MEIALEASVHAGCNWLAEPSAQRPANATQAESNSTRTGEGDSLCRVQPTLLHVTHWKSGSQWIHKILVDCARERIVPPEVGSGQFLERAVLAGKVYPTVYVTREEFASVRLPPHCKRFVVVRDLRDTLISGYFSLKYSHPLMDIRLNRWREHLQTESVEDGILRIMTDGWLDYSVRIQRSWALSGEPLLRYEDLLKDDWGILSKLFLEDCPLGVSAERLHEIIVANRFERLTAGRPRGQEDVAAHERKGIAGDWRNYFTPRIKDAFKARFNYLLIATGYEEDAYW